jgi:hypothetical protein
MFDFSHGVDMPVPFAYTRYGESSLPDPEKVLYIRVLEMVPNMLVR